MTSKYFDNNAIKKNITNSNRKNGNNTKNVLNDVCALLSLKFRNIINVNRIIAPAMTEYSAISASTPFLLFIPIVQNIPITHAIIIANKKFVIFEVNL
jgi:hypothetical protein